MEKHPRAGRWSDLRKRFLEENRPEELKQMQKNGTLTEYLSPLRERRN